MGRPAAGLGLLSVLLIVAACGESVAGGGPSPDSGDGSELAGRTFVSTGDAGIPGGGPLNLGFTGDGRLSASAGCNSGTGPVQLAGGRLAAADLAMTEMGCPPDGAAADQWLIDLLSAEPGWELTDPDTLVLSAGDREITLVDRDVLEPPVELTGRRWDVDGLVDGELASSMPAGVEAHLRIDDGVLTGSTGCNEVSARADVDAAAGTVMVTDLVVTDAACPGAAEQVQEIVLAVLSGELRFSVTGDRLSLEAPTGHGLRAVSAD